MKVDKERFPFLAFQQPWSDNPNNIWIASTLNLYRNLARYLFPPRLEADGQKRVLDLLSKALLSSEAANNPHFVRAEAVEPLEKEFLYEHFLTPRAFQQAMEGEGFLTDGTGQIFAIINVRDHLQLQLINCRDPLEQAWNRLAELEASVSRTLDFAYSQRFGYLTADPQLCGTGLVVQIFLHLPALSHTQGLDLVQEEEVDSQAIAGDILTLRNRCTLGLSDEDIIQLMQTCALKLMVKEKGARRAMREETAMKDRISRALGILTHSYQQETAETWGALSLLKLGIDLGWVSGVTHPQLNGLLFASQRAHLVANCGQEVEAPDIPHKRAELLHSALADAQLAF